jgi:hypothetical protein
MALPAVGHYLPGDMWRVAVQTVRDLVMRRVTRYACQLAVTACKLGNFLALFFMTGHAFDSGVARELERVHRAVRFSMALLAVLQFQVRGAGVAARTRCNEVGPIGQMFTMTVNAGNGGLVFAAFSPDLCLFIAMAFNAVRRIQMRGFPGQARRHADCGQQNDCAAYLYE